MAGRRRFGRSHGEPIDDRTWSTHANVDPTEPSRELVDQSALPAETGPTWAPDRLSVWPVEGGRYGIDAHYHGRTGVERARHHAQRLKAHGLVSSFKKDRDGGLLRLGPLTHAAVWLALEAFLGAPMPPVEVDEERLSP
jgi:hypothetical protein